MSYTSDRRWYLDKSGNATDDPARGVRLIVGEGGIIEDADAERYGMTTRKAKPVDSKEIAGPAETKHVSGPAHTKGRK